MNVNNPIGEKRSLNMEYFTNYFMSNLFGTLSDIMRANNFQFQCGDDISKCPFYALLKKLISLMYWKHNITFLHYR